MIPPGIKALHVLQALDLAALKQYASNRDFHRHALIFEGEHYPVKVVIDLAELIVHEGSVPAERARQYLVSKKSDFNAIEAKQFLVKLGFPVNSTDDGNEDGFFQLSDLEFYQRMAGEEYDAANPVLHNAGHYVANTVWEKSREWGRRVEQQSSLKLVEGKRWLDRGRRGEKTQRIKKYTWYKLTGDGPLADKVFYTVGVWGPDRQLIMKLDCLRSGTDALEPAQVEAFDQFISDRATGELIIEYDELMQWNWRRLLAASREFINLTLGDYHDAMSLIAQEHKNVCARICYNRFGWTAPSGKEGKSNTHTSVQEFLQERDYGFAPDEWLFDLDRIADDGYHYARIEPLTPQSHVGKRYNILFYTRNYSDGAWYWVGEIKHVEAISPEQSTAINAEYQRKGWLQEQVSQLQQWEGVQWEQYQNMDAAQRFNMRFRAIDCIIFDCQPFAADEKVPSYRYNLADRVSDPLPHADQLIGGLDLSAGRTGPAAKVIGKQYRGGYKELDNVHGEVQDAFMEYFPAKLPDLRFFPEVRKTGLQNRVDIVACFRDTEKYIFYEIKTYPNVMQSIRVAVGQLLEYAFYPQQDLCRVFYIVSHIRANNLELSYLLHLGKTLSMQFGYIYFDRKSREFEIQC